MKNKIVIKLIFAFIIALSFNIVESKAASLEKTSIDLYAIDSIYEKNYSIEIPSNYAQNYKINVKGATSTPKYEVIEGEDVIEVNENGLVTPIKNSYTLSSISTNQTSQEYKYKYKTAKVSITVGTQKLILSVTLNDYVNTYCEEILNKFIKENIKSDMTDYQKLDVITKYTAEEYDYSTKASGYRGMILNGGGDCWASTSMIVKLCKKVGLQAHSRNANLDAGAGSGHTNAVVLIDGTLYIAEAGYNEKKPRYYDIYPEKSGYTIEVLDYKNKTASIVQYDGFDTELVVPSEINGYKIVEIGKGAFGRSYANFTSIKLPETIETLKINTFASCTELESVTIPKSVKTIEGPIFFRCEALKNINISGNYIVSDNILYTADKSKLIELIPTYDKKTVTIPSSVKEIGKYAFYNSKLKGLTVPSTCKAIGDYAFASSPTLASVIIENGVTTIGKGAFDSVFTLQSVQIPESVTTIGEDAFKSSISNVKIYGTKGSTAENYASQNNLTFVASTANVIDRYMVQFDNDLVYNGKKQELNITVIIGSNVLVKGKDYSVTYDSNCENAGTHKAVVNGIGKYSGEVTLQYYVDRADSGIEVSINDAYILGEKILPVITKNPYNLSTYFMYGKVGGNSYSSSTPTEEGEYKVYLSINNRNYKSVTIEKTIKIIKSELPFTDIKSSDWFYNSVKYVYKNKFITGYSDTTFAPRDNLTRGMMVTILYRMENYPSVTGTPKFSDVQDSNQYYYKAIKWATDKKIVNGYNNGKFGPKDNITREQLAVILNNYANYKKKNTNISNELDKFTDKNSISSYAVKQMKWAVGVGVISGNPDGTLNPQGKATRAEVAAMLENYRNKVK